MIKPINVTLLNTSNELLCECGKCGHTEKIKLSGNIINTDNEGNPLEPLSEYQCSKCGEIL